MAVNLQAQGVASVHKEYANFAGKWQRCRDVASGRDAVKARETEYLPALKDQLPQEYAAYLKRASFYNATWRTVAGFMGMLFRKPPNLTIPESAKPLLEDITMSGVTFDNFAQNLTYEDIVVSRAGIFVDYPAQDGKTRTLAEAERDGLRPTMSLYTTEAIINWRKGRVNNRTVLTQVRLLEDKTEVKDEFTTETYEVVRVLDLDENNFYRQRLFKAENGAAVPLNDAGDTVIYPLMNGQKMTYIPFYPIGPDGTQLEPDDPILIDLVDINLDHFRVSADYEQACHTTAIPTPWVTGFQDDPNNPQTFYMGSTTFWKFSDPNAKVGMLEYTGAGLDKLEKNLERKEAQMAALGARMLAPEKAGVEAAQTLAIRSNGENSVLAAIAVAVSDGLTQALQTFCAWAGITGEIKYEINRDFVPLSVDAQTLTAWLAMLQAGRMSPQEFFELLKRADLVDPEKKFEDHQGEVENDSLALPKPLTPEQEAAARNKNNPPPNSGGEDNE